MHCTLLGIRFVRYLCDFVLSIFFIENRFVLLSSFRCFFCSFDFFLPIELRGFLQVIFVRRLFRQIAIIFEGGEVFSEAGKIGTEFMQFFFFTCSRAS